MCVCVCVSVCLCLCVSVQLPFSDKGMKKLSESFRHYKHALGDEEARTAGACCRTALHLYHSWHSCVVPVAASCR